MKNFWLITDFRMKLLQERKISWNVWLRLIISRDLSCIFLHYKWRKIHGNKKESRRIFIWFFNKTAAHSLHEFSIYHLWPHQWPNHSNLDINNALTSKTCVHHVVVYSLLYFYETPTLILFPVSSISQNRITLFSSLLCLLISGF